MIRLDKMLAHMGYGSRKEVKELIRKGNVIVDGIKVKSDDIKVSEDSEIIIFNEEVKYDEFIYLMFNKPSGIVSATFDNHDETVIDYIPKYAHMNIFPIGRLDKDTEGLLLITNDGLLTHKLLSPKNNIFKKYYVKYEGNIDNKLKNKFENGLDLGDFTTKEAKLELLDDNCAYVTITEGKFHQVKRMFEAIGSKVIYLKRIEFAGIKLDENLEYGSFRWLTEEEMNILKNI